MLGLKLLKHYALVAAIKKQFYCFPITAQTGFVNFGLQFVLIVKFALNWLVTFTVVLSAGMKWFNTRI